MSAEAGDPAEAVKGRVEFLLGVDLSSRWNDDQQLGWAGIMAIAGLLSAKHNREMQAKHGLSLTLLTLLGRLDACGGATVQARHLARDMDLSPGKVSRHLATLEEARLLSRQASADDGRALDVELTDSGRTRLAGARRTAVEIVERDYLSHLSRSELATLARIARKILRAADDTDSATRARLEP